MSEFRRRLMMAGGGSVLPYDAEVEYLEGTGTQYIETGYIPQGNDIKIKGRFYLSGYTGNYASWFGAYTNESTNSFRIVRNNNSNKIIYYTGGTQASTSGLASCSLNTEFYFELSYNRLILNGVTFTHSGSSNTENARELFLWTNSTHSVFTEGKYYYFQVYKNDVLVLDLIPVRVGLVGYMYDRVSGRMLGNGGSGNFNIGLDKPTITSEVEYLSSDSTAYINTGITSNDSVEIEIEFSLANYIQYAAIIGNYSNSSTPCVRIIEETSNTLVLNLNNAPSQSGTAKPSYTLGYRHTIKFGKSYYTVDGVTTSYAFNVNNPQFRSIAAFNVNINGSTIKDIGLKIYYLKMWYNGELVRDYIPVRIENVGYFLDKVSGYVYGNIGSGSFNYGQDI